MIKYTELVYGELYLTTKELVWSNFDENYSQITVPSEEQLLFRSFQTYGNHKDSELSLFYWLKQRTTVCLVCSPKTPVLHIKHIDWDKRTRLDKIQTLKES